MIKCVCIDSDNKPKEIPMGKWIQEGFFYHIDHVWYHPGQGIQGVSLREIRLGKESAPYESFKMSRFAIQEKDVDLFMELMKSCSELDDIDIEEIMKQGEVNVLQ